MTDHNNKMNRNNARVGLGVLVVVVAMVGLSFAAVPLYSVFCRVTGFGGTTQVSESAPDNVLKRIVTVQFNADTGRNIPWKFAPEQRQIKVNIGQKALASFSVHNMSTLPVAGTALYNVAPFKVGKYFHKIQCFCFSEQILQPGEKVSMPVLFFIDPKLAEDPHMDDISTITLSYTFFKTESEDLDRALEDFYNDVSENSSLTE